MQSTPSQSSRRALRGVAGLVAISALVGSTAVVAQSPSASPMPPVFNETPAPVGTLGTPEQPFVTFGYRLPSLNSVAPILVANDRGYWQECGLEGVALVQTEQTQTGVVTGSLDVGIVESVDTGDAQINGLPLKVIGGYRPYSRNIIAVRPEITSPADLAGKDILLGGTPGTRDYDVRVNLLKEAGYDLEGIAFNAVTVDGGSDAWVALLREGKLALTPVFNRHYNSLAAEGYQFWLDSQNFGSDHLAANSDWLAANPNSATAFLCGIIKGIQVWSDPANKDYILGLGEGTGITITDGVRDAYERDIENYKSFDGGFPLEEMQKLFEENLESPVDMAALMDFGALNAAQAYLGLPLNPAP